jgi:tetratricopeptide (TPR) repeat protein
MVGLGRYDDAATAYETMVNLDPSLPALSRLAQLAFIRGETLNTPDFWRQAIEKSRDYPPENLAWAHVQLGNVYLARGDYNAAAKEQEQALVVYPDFVHALAGLGAVRAAQERWDDSIALYERAIERLPQPQYVAALGDVYARAGRASDAESQYALVEAIDSLYRANNINTDLALALFYADHDRQLDRALTMAQAAYTQAPNIYAADALAWALYKNGRVEEAAAMSKDALRTGILDASFYYHAGVIAQALGTREEARQQLEHALKLNPHFSVLHSIDAKERLEALKR